MTRVEHLTFDCLCFLIATDIDISTIWRNRRTDIEMPLQKLGCVEPGTWKPVWIPYLATIKCSPFRSPLWSSLTQIGPDPTSSSFSTGLSYLGLTSHGSSQNPTTKFNHNAPIKYEASCLRARVLQPTIQGDEQKASI